MRREILIQNFEMMFKARGMSPAHGRVFGVLYLNGKLTQKGLAEDTGYSVPAVSVALDELTRVGLVSKHKVPAQRSHEYSVDHDLPMVFRKFLRKVLEEHVTPFRMLLRASGEKDIYEDVKNFERYLERIVEVE